MKKTYRIITLGCRANQFDSAVMERSLAAAGYSPAEDGGPAGVVVVNTCTVTHKADKQSRQLLRRAVREHPGATVIAAGCLAQLETDDLAGLEGVDLVIGPADQTRLGELLAAGRSGAAATKPGREFSDFGPAPLQGRSRALLKVQDGCNNACAYCRVRLARGRSRSLAFDRALAAAGELAEAGYEEIVLTGVHLGFYGQDLDPPTDLTALVKALLADETGPRLRLSSVEPSEISDELLETAAASNRFCPHFHLPLQSGDAGVLEAMNRPYGPAAYAEVVARIRARLPEAAIGADVMVGFPGEDEAAFERSYHFVEELALDYLHVFPFSPRPGTKAAGLSGRVDPAVVNERAKLLRELGRKKRRAFLAQLVGRETEIVVEGRRDAETGLLTGLTPAYASVLIDDAEALMNRRVKVKIVARQGEKLIGRVLS